MILDCKNCKNKFTLIEDEVQIEGKIVQCTNCKEEWIYESKSLYLENRLTELDKDLYKIEIKINERNNKYNIKIDTLEKDLKIKKEELTKQKSLEERTAMFEKRITETEKSNSEQADLEIKIVKIENEVEKITENIFTTNKDIEKKTNYLEMKINSYDNDNDNVNNNHDRNKESIEVNDNEKDVVDLRIFEKQEKKKYELGENNKKKSFFWRSKH